MQDSSAASRESAASVDRRALAATFVLAFAQDAIYGLVYLSYMNHYLLGRLHASGGSPGYVLAVYGATKLVVHPVAGRLLDRTTPRLLLRFSIGVQGAAVVLLLFFHTLWAFVGATLLLATGSAAMWPLVYDTIARTQAPAARSTVTAMLAFAGYVATGLGFASGVLLARTIHWRIPFLIAGVLIAGPLVMDRMHTFDPGEHALAASHNGPRVPLLQRLRAVALFGAVVLADYAAITSLAAAYGPFTRISLGISLLRTTFLLAPAAVAALGSLWLSARSSRPGRRLLEMAVLYVLAAVGALGLALAPNQWVAMAAAPILAAGAGGIGPIVAATMVEQGQAGDRGTIVGTLMSIEGVGSVAGPALTAVVIDLANPRAGLAFIAALFIILIPLCLVAQAKGAGITGQARARA